MARKAAATLRVEAHGRSAHSGSAPHKGAARCWPSRASLSGGARHDPEGPTGSPPCPPSCAPARRSTWSRPAGELICDLRADRLERSSRVLDAVPLSTTTCAWRRVWCAPGRAWTRARPPRAARRRRGGLGRPIVASERGGASDASHLRRRASRSRSTGSARAAAARTPRTSGSARSRSDPRRGGAGGGGRALLGSLRGRLAPLAAPMTPCAARRSTSATSAAGARLVPFAGWEMPVQYEGIRQEHVAVRTAAGMFDVSHMGEIETSGPAGGGLPAAVLSNDVTRDRRARRPVLGAVPRGRRRARRPLHLPARPRRSASSPSRTPPTTSKDLAWFREQAAGFDVEVQDAHADWAMLAVQGPGRARRSAAWPRASFPRGCAPPSCASRARRRSSAAPATPARTAAS